MRPAVDRARRLSYLLGVIAAFGWLVAAPAARATMPGANGRLVYDSLLASGRFGLFLDGAEPLTDPGTAHDMWPAWSPDGQQVAFIRWGQDPHYLLELVNRDGTGLRQVFSSAVWDQPNRVGARIVTGPTWSPDGQRLALPIWHPVDAGVSGLWIIRPDGSGLSQLIRYDHFPSQSGPLWPEWSPLGNEILYLCRRTADSNAPIDICIIDVSTRIVRRLQIALPAPLFPVGPGNGPLEPESRPKWTPDGKRIVFSARHAALGRLAFYEDLFSVNADGTAVQRLTNPPVISCSGTPTALRHYSEPAPSPDGEWLVAWASTQCAGSSDQGLWVLPAKGGAGAPVVVDIRAQFADWQPLPAKLVVHVDDGHGNPLRGVKVQLRRAADTQFLPDRPLNTAGGSYAFETVGPGGYVLRATLVDDTGDPEDVPSFDVRYTEGAPLEPVWIERKLTVQADAEQVNATISFQDSPVLTGSNVEPDVRHRLDDVANVYFRVRQFVDWVKARLTPDTGQTVEYYTFASSDIISGDPIETDEAFYLRSMTAVFFGMAQSEYENRDGVEDAGHDDDAPENGEWHEFAHHLFYQSVSSSPCGDPSHGGYNNPGSCDSLEEGFAAFLATLAAQAIEGVADSIYDGIYDAEGNHHAWAGDGTQEDDAVAALLWDVVDSSVDVVASLVIAENGSHVPVTYTDQVRVSLQSLWAQLGAAHPSTVYDLRRSFGNPTLTLDLDGDSVPDVAPIDVPFLMHGFFRIEDDQTIDDTHWSHHYDVADGSSPRNASVGLTSHRVYDASGTVTKTLSPRFKKPLDPRSQFEIEVRDASGTPLSGARLDLVVQSPTGLQTTSRRLGSGDGALVHLELPPYFDYLLPDGAPLPPCDPAHDVQVAVTVTATLNGYASTDTPQFDNCAFWRGREAASGPAALSLAVSFPEDSTAPVTTIATTTAPPPVPDGTTGSWTVSLSCEDPVENGFASGCARSEVRLDGGPIAVYDGPIVLAQPGAHTLEFRSVDAAANEEAFRSVALDVLTVCGDGIDNDGDSLVDFPADDGCAGALARSEIRVDLDFDGAVGDSDRDAFAAAFGHSEDDPAYLPEADFDSDRRITIVDYQRWLAGYEAHLAAQAIGCGLGGVELLGVLLGIQLLRRRRR